MNSSAILSFYFVFRTCKHFQNLVRIRVEVDSMKKVAHE